MLSTLFFLITLCQVGLSTYCLYLSSIAILKLQKYEGMSKTAAKYSNVAENQLYKTRTTQTSSVIAVCAPSPLPSLINPPTNC